MSNVPINLLILIVFVVGVILLQIYLSKRENKWLGLILPIISFLFSLVIILNMAFYSNVATQSTSPDGTIERIVTEGAKPLTDNVSIVLQAVYVFIISNIPTAILMLIYFSCRQKIKQRREMDKMQIQDLEG